VVGQLYFSVLIQLRNFETKNLSLWISALGHVISVYDDPNLWSQSFNFDACGCNHFSWSS